MRRGEGWIQEFWLDLGGLGRCWPDWDPSGGKKKVWMSGFVKRQESKRKGNQTCGWRPVSNPDIADCWPRSPWIISFHILISQVPFPPWKIPFFFFLFPILLTLWPKQKTSVGFSVKSAVTFLCLIHLSRFGTDFSKMKYSIVYNKCMPGSLYCSVDCFFLIQ